VLELVFFTAPEYELLEPFELLERLEQMEATDDTLLSLGWVAVFAELFEIRGGFFSGWKCARMVAFPLLSLFLWLCPLALFPAGFAMVDLIFCLY